MRKPRYYYESNFYHIMVQGDEKKYIFQEYKQKKKYLYLMRRNAVKNFIEIIAYCIMDNHVHILVYCPDFTRLPKYMCETNTSYALYFNKKREKVGHVFRDRYRSESIYTKYHLLNCIKYIHYNPVKAKICHSCNQYMFSSFNKFRKNSKRIMDLCDFGNENMKSIVLGNCENFKFLEDEYSKEDVREALKIILENNDFIKNSSKDIAKIYLLLNERCKTNDKDIADVLGISRGTLFRYLKKEKIK